ncbi:(d)CMP kinase [Polycyclovorans algicola]|uniref:(d)CMP kinase n=1 Tax=Polycyclovorans algicola TaxID=616992 RepID=UPI0004A6BAEE|nr:(d)CMP kinase [Polycyclovorans algicola]
MRRNAPVIAIDGPSGVGKGTVTQTLARMLGWHRLDSGALYRALAIAAASRNIALDDEAALANVAAVLDVVFDERAGQERIVLDGVDVTVEIRQESTGDQASKVAVWPAVRRALVDRQHAFRQPPGLIADGRDMGTVIFPDAELKIFLTASPDARAQRRHGQLAAQGRHAILADLCLEIEGRDRRDQTRATAPLVPAEDALTIDTTLLSPEAVMAEVTGLLKARGLR